MKNLKLMWLKKRKRKKKEKKDNLRVSKKEIQINKIV